MSINPIQKQKIKLILKRHEPNLAIDPDLLEIQLTQFRLSDPTEWQTDLRAINIISADQAFIIIDQQIEKCLQNDRLYNQSPYRKLNQLSAIANKLETLLNEQQLPNIYVNIADLIRGRPIPITYQNLIQNQMYFA